MKAGGQTPGAGIDSGGRSSDLPSFEHAQTLVQQSLTEFQRWGKVLAARRKNSALQVLPRSAPEATGLSLRARGWLHHLWRKATAPHGSGKEDDWTASGKPHEWWDMRTGAPMNSFPRFDLHESSYAVALMSERTPAWREVYVKILDGLTSRYITHWAAVDFLNQFGPDPSRSEYPSSWRGTLVFADLWGDYDTPGWTANGCRKELVAVESDPIQARAMLFFKGWLTLVMSLRGQVAGGQQNIWDSEARPWPMANVGGTYSRWTLSNLAKTLATRFNDNNGSGLH